MQKLILMKRDDFVDLVEEAQFEAFAKLLTFETLGKMAYLQAALSETLRLFPAVPLVLVSILLSFLWYQVVSFHMSFASMWPQSFNCLLFLNFLAVFSGFGNHYKRGSIIHNLMRKSASKSVRLRVSDKAYIFLQFFSIDSKVLLSKIWGEKDDHLQLGIDTKTRCSFQQISQWTQAFALFIFEEMKEQVSKELKRARHLEIFQLGDLIAWREWNIWWISDIEVWNTVWEMLIIHCCDLCGGRTASKQ